MKKLKQISKILLTVFILFGVTSTSFSQERKESFEKTYNISSAGDFSFDCYETDLKVNTWNKEEVKLIGELIIGGGDTEDQEKLIEVFKNPNVTSSANYLSIKTDLAQNTIIIGPFKKITLVNGKTIRIDKFEVKYTLWIPETISFKLKSKYNDIDIANLKGNIHFDLYEVDLTLASFNTGELNMKYSSAEIGNGKSAKFDNYECELEIKNIESMEARTKYSDYNIEKLGKLEVGSYEDDFEIESLSEGLIGQAKYSDFKIGSNVENIDMDVYESDIEVLNVKNVEYASKYSTFKAQNIGSMKCRSLYEAKIYAATVGEFSCQESKYDNISFHTITKSIEFPSAYELELDVEKVDPSFKLFSGDFKYGSIDLPLDPKLEFSLEFKSKYGDVDFPKNRLKINILNFEDDNKEFKGQTKENALCKIEFTSYDTSIDLE